MASVFNSVFKTGIYAHYTVSSTPTFTNTPWVIYDAKSIKTKQKCSLFKFDKKLFEQYVYEGSKNSFGNMSRSTYKLILAEAMNYARAYVNNMIKFKHPNILSVIEPLEERQNSMIFITELVTIDLLTYVKEQIQKGNYTENELILINGLSQTCGALDFLHNNANMVHLNLIPANIFITEKLDFKLSGFNFSEKYDSNSSKFNFILPDERFPKFLSINFDFSDPSLIIDHDISFANDIFSLGCLIYYLLNLKPGKKIIDSNNDLYDYKSAINKLKTTNLNFKFQDGFLNSNFSKLIDLNPNLRVAIADFKNSSVFNNELLNSLDFINNFDSKTLIEKNVFLRGFDARNYFQRFPKFILIDKFLPILKSSISNIANLVIFPITLTCIFRVSKNLSNLSYCNLLLDVFKPIIIKSNKKNMELNIICFTEIQIIILNHLKSILNKIGTVSAGSFKKVEKSFLIPLINHVLTDGAMSIEQIQNEANSNAIQNAFNTVKTLGQISPEKLEIQEKFVSNLSLIISTLNSQSQQSQQPQTQSESMVDAVTNSMAGVASGVSNALSGNITTAKFIENEVFPKVSQVFKTTSSMKIKTEVIRNFITLVGEQILSPTYSSKKIIPLLIAVKQKGNILILNELYDFYSLYLVHNFLFEKELIVETILPELLKLSFNSNELTVEKFNTFFELIVQFERKLKEKQLIHLEKYNDKNIIRNNSLASNQKTDEYGSPIAESVNSEQNATFESILNGNKPNTVSTPARALTGGLSFSSEDIPQFNDSLKFDESSNPTSMGFTTLTPNNRSSNNTPVTQSTRSSSNTPVMSTTPSFGVMQTTRSISSGSFNNVLTPKPLNNVLSPKPSNSSVLSPKPMTSSITSTPTNNSIDWSVETSKINKDKITLASNNVLTPKSRTPNNNMDNNNKNKNNNNLPPGFSGMGLIQPMKPKNNNNSNNDQFKKASDNFFDSFI